MVILGVNAYHGDASAVIVIDGKLIAAAEEERFNRIKHSAGFPAEALKYCLEEASVSIKDIDYIAIPRKPLARFFKKLYYGIKIPRLAIRRFTALHKTQNIKKTIAGIFQMDEGQIGAKIINVEHHKAHIASSFFVSGLDKALLFSVDGLGDFASTMWGIGEANKINIMGEVSFPHSLGLCYTAITQYLGFLNYGDEYKVMGLASYGQPAYQDEFRKILINDSESGFRLGLDYFLHHRKLTDMHFEEGYPSLDIVYSPYLEKRLGNHRLPSGPIEVRHHDIAATLQKRLEEEIFSLLNKLYKLNKLNKLCMSGGVAFNCVMNGKISDNTFFEDVYVPPAAGDAGLAIGAAYYVWHQILNKPRSFVMEHAYWGPAYREDEIRGEVEARSGEFNKSGCQVEEIKDDTELCVKTAECISQGKIVGWFQGRMEWGPRALGNRSILVDPRRNDMKDILNNRIKHREPFRPFAPSVLEDRISEYFEKTHPSPFMQFCYKVRPEKRAVIPATVHVDGTARVQTVNKGQNPLFWKLIKEFEKITDVPVLLNTSFNENEPIVTNPREAVECFLRTRMDMLAMGKYLIKK